MAKIEQKTTGDHIAATITPDWIDDYIPELTPPQHLCLLLAMKRQMFEQHGAEDDRYKAYDLLAKDLEKEVGGFWSWRTKIGVIY